jgi:hypothetical protein
MWPGAGNGCEGPRDARGGPGWGWVRQGYLEPDPEFPGKGGSYWEEAGEERWGLPAGRMRLMRMGWLVI